jgi:hypothetical protein
MTADFVGKSERNDAKNAVIYGKLTCLPLGAAFAAFHVLDFH